MKTKKKFKAKKFFLIFFKIQKQMLTDEEMKRFIDSKSYLCLSPQLCHKICKFVQKRELILGF